MNKELSSIMRESTGETVFHSDGTAHHNASKTEFDQTLAAELVKRTRKLGNNEVELALQVKEAREFLDWSNGNMRASWLDWMEEASKQLQELRMLRMSLSTEKAKIAADIKDLRELMLSKESQDALFSMQNLCECLSKLQDIRKSGLMEPVLDALCGKKS